METKTVQAQNATGGTKQEGTKMEKILFTAGKLGNAMDLDIDPGITLAQALFAADPGLLETARCGKMKLRLDGHFVRPDQLDDIVITQDGSEAILAENIRGNDNPGR